MDTEHVQSVIDGAGGAGTKRLVVAIALVLNMLDGFDITAMAFTAHSVGEALSIDADRLGIVFSATLAGMMVGAMFIAPLADTIGRRKLILLCVLAIGSSMYATAHITGFWQLVFLRCFTGLGVGGMLASLAALTSEFTPEKYRSLAVVSVTAGYPLGATVGGFVAAPLLASQGWQSVFLLGSAVTLAMALIIYFLLPESLQFLVSRRPKDALQRTNALLERLESLPLTVLPPLPPHQGDERASVASLLHPERRATTLTLWATFFFCFISLYFLMSWIPKLVVISGLGESQGVYASVAFNGGAVLGVLALGTLAARLELSKVISAFLSIAAVVMVVFVSLGETGQLLAYLLVIGFMLQGGFCGLYAVAAKIYPTQIRSTGVGWAIGLGRFGAVVGPYLGGVLIANGVSMETNFLIFAMPLFVAGLMAFILRVA